MEQEDIFFRDCILCPRQCHVDRTRGEPGFCGMGAKIKAARAALHYWEEPCISGERGSGAVFFSGCSLGCAYCQNRRITQEGFGKELKTEELSGIFLRLQKEGAANINLVTASHFAPLAAQAVAAAKERGLRIPVVYNCGGYEALQTLRLLEGLVDVYLPDAKYADPGLAETLSAAPDYPEISMEAIAEMLRQTGPCVFDENGYIIKGTIVRHLVLPGHTKNSLEVLRALHERFGSGICISILNQYTPMTGWERNAYRPPDERLVRDLDRRVTAREYDKVLAFALSLGMENGFFQEGETAKEGFIPRFDLEGL